MGGATAIWLTLLGSLLHCVCCSSGVNPAQVSFHADQGGRVLSPGNWTYEHNVAQDVTGARIGAASTQSRSLQQEQHAVLPQDAQQLLQSKGPPEGNDVSAGAVLLLTIIMAAASCLGAVPFFFVGTLSTRWSALANAIACGVMLAASFDLVHEGEPYGAGLVIVGIMIGSLFIWASQRWLEQFEDVKFESLRGANARKVLLVVGIMAAHALGEGSGVGVSFCGQRGWSQGLLVTIAIGLHNVPEGLAVATVLVAKGISPMHAFWWTLATSLPQPLLALPSFMFVDAFQALLPLALGFAAGCMVWIVFAELLPDALAGAPHTQVATAATMSAAVLEAMRMALHALEERRSVSDKMGWEGSTLLRPAAELAAIAAMSILIGTAVAATSLADMPKLAAASSIMTCFGGVVLMDSFFREGSFVTVAGSLVGAIVLWQVWWLLVRSSQRKSTTHKDLDVEGGPKPQPDSVSLRVFSTELPPAVHGWKGDSSPEKALGLTSPRLGRPSSALKWRSGSMQLYRSVSQLCSAILVLAAACEGYRMASALQGASAYYAIAHGLARGGAMAAISAYLSLLPQNKSSARGWWTVLAVSGLGPIFALVMLSTSVTLMAPIFPWLTSAVGGAQLLMGLCVVRPLAWQVSHKRTTISYGLGAVVSLAMLYLPYAPVVKRYLSSAQ